MLIPTKFSGYRADGSRVLPLGGNGGGSSGTQQVTQTNLPEYARPYFEGQMDSAVLESARPYAQYEGPRVAGFNDFQQNAFNQTYGMQSPQGMDLANQFAGNAAGAAQGQLDKTGNWQTGQFDYSRFIDNGNPEAYMSPYMRNVADITKREATRDFGIQQTGRDAQAAQAGAFGGYRQAIENSEAGRNLNQQMQDIDYRAQQDAYTNAQGQFNADRNARFGVQGAEEQSRQFGGNLGLQGLAGSAGMMNALSGLGQSDQQLLMSRIGAMMGAGDTMQQHQQGVYDMGSNDFQNQQFWNRDNMNFFSSMLRGLPVQGTQTSTTYQPQPNLMSQFGGAGLAGLAMAQST